MVRIRMSYLSKNYTNCCKCYQVTESYAKSISEQEKLKKSFGQTGSNVTKMSVEMEDIRECLEVFLCLFYI